LFPSSIFLYSLLLFTDDLLRLLFYFLHLFLLSCLL
jgi:hypothetical protein